MYNCQKVIKCSKKESEEMVKDKITNFPDLFIKEVKERACAYEAKFGDCCQCVVAPFQEILGLGNDLVLKTATFFAGGMGNAGKTCGALTGGVMVLGMLYGREDLEGSVDDILKSIHIVQALVKKFEKKYGTTSCREITKVDLTDNKAFIEFFEGSAHEKCFEVVGETAAMVAEIIINQKLNIYREW